MILRYKPWNENIILRDGVIAQITIESSTLLDQFTFEMLQTSRGNGNQVSLLKGDKELDFNKNIILINSPAELEYSSFSTKKKLHQLLSAEAEDNGQGYILEQLHSQMVAILDELVINSDYRLTFDPGVSIADYMSLFKVALQEPDGPFSERLVEYMDTINQLLGIRVFIVINCNCYIDGTGFNVIEDVVKRQGYSLSFIDHQMPHALPESIETHIIDIDHCNIDDQTCCTKSQCSSGIYSEIII